MTDIYTKDLNIGNIPVGQWFPNNSKGEIRIRQKNNNMDYTILLLVDIAQT